jgi:hypothetical protein
MTTGCEHGKRREESEIDQELPLQVDGLEYLWQGEGWCTAESNLEPTGSILQ